MGGGILNLGLLLSRLVGLRPLLSFASLELLATLALLAPLDLLSLKKHRQLLLLLQDDLLHLEVLCLHGALVLLLVAGVELLMLVLVLVLVLLMLLCALHLCVTLLLRAGDAYSNLIHS